MPKISFYFFVTGGLFVLAGMGLGIWMGVKEDFVLAPVHAHLNLVGWASMGLMGTFYALAGDKAPRRLAWINYFLMTVAVLVMTPTLAILVRGDKSITPVLGVSEILALLGMVTFVVAVLITWSNSRKQAA